MQIKEKIKYGLLYKQNSPNHIFFSFTIYAFTRLRAKNFKGFFIRNFFLMAYVAPRSKRLYINIRSWLRVKTIQLLYVMKGVYITKIGSDGILITEL